MGHRIQLAAISLIALLLISTNAFAFDGRPLFGNLHQTPNPSATQGRYFFALSKNTYTGALGGIAGADAKCLSELKNNNWRGKDSSVILNKNTVKAFICDATCRALQANTGYVFTVVGDLVNGGGSIYSNASGVGPGTVGFSTTALAWSTGYGFGSAVGWWSGRIAGILTAWGTTGAASRCTDWSTTAGTGQAGSTSLTTTGLWTNTTPACSVAARLICVVTSPGPDDTPNVFDFTNNTTAVPDTFVEASQTVSGFTGSLLASVMATDSGYLEVRKNGTGAWGPFVAIQAGETLNIRMMSPPSATSRTMYITLGTALVDWLVTSLDNTVNAFTLAETGGATPSTVYETSVVPAGYTTPVTFTSTGTGEVRKNGTGVWSTSVILNPGDTLNVRMTSSATVGGTVSTLVSGGGASATWYLTNAKENMFILTSTTWNASLLGGMAGANTKCLTNLTAVNFPGKAGVTLNASTVKAFLCDSTGCQNPDPNETYFFAVANNMTLGGASFTTNGAGMGPGDSTAWNGASYFGSSVSFPTGRGLWDDNFWAPFHNTPSTTGHSYCVEWTNTGLGSGGSSNQTDAQRWNSSFGSACSSAFPLICMVTSNPNTNTPNAFSFTDTYTSPNTTVETSAVISGFTGTRAAGAGNGAEVRKNGTGAWTSLVDLSPGDTLNVRFTTTSTAGAGHIINVFAGNTHTKWNVFNQRENLFVRSSAGTTGALGGLAGANTYCLNDLNANNFQGKGSVTLNASTVKAFLCDSTTCQNPEPNKTYYFAVSGDTNAGGASFTADANGLGPGDSASWLSSAYFGTTGFLHWTGRSSASTTKWPSSVAAGLTCSDWTSSGTSGQYGTNSNSSFGRWSSTNITCGSTYRLICIVTSNPIDTTPNAFSFADTNGAVVSAVYETSAVISGFTGTIQATVDNGAEVRVNGTGSWGPTVSVTSGDTLNVRQTASATLGAAVVTTVSVGSAAATWTIRNAKTHLLVMTSGSFNGNLGGLAGANTTCLNDLTANDFLGKTDVTLNATTVQAFLCNAGTCQSPAGGKNYFFATSGVTSTGGGYFLSNAGQGPGDAVTWSDQSRFGLGGTYWTGRASASATNWSLGTGASHCTGWTLTTGNGIPGTAGSSAATRWTNTAQACTTNSRLLCMVRSNTPSTFTLATVEGTTPSTYYETSTVIAGLYATGSVLTGHEGIELRKNGTGGWGTSVSVDNGDTLNIRLMSSATPGAEVTGRIAAYGDVLSSWTVRNLRENLFVLGSFTYSSPTLASANSNCLTNLTSQNFAGKTGLTLNASTVKAFMCDETGCQNPKPNTLYWFAQAGSTTQGGATFTTDNLGRGPQDSSLWATTSRFTSNVYWSGRDTAGGTSTLWGVIPSATNCAQSSSAVIGNTNSNTEARWSSGTIGCGSFNRYMCMVTSTPSTPNVPNAFSFTDLYKAFPNTVYETSTALSGFTGTLTAFVSTNGEIRKNGTGAWGTEVDVSAGDTLNLRMTSSATSGAMISTTVVVGTEPNSLATWRIYNIRPNNFVLTAASYTGNLGGLSGANASCLAALNGGSFAGKDHFDSIPATAVKAFLCDGTTCQSTFGSGTYHYAIIGSTTLGGYFNTNSSGLGPNDAVAWSDATRFGTTGTYWAGRSSTSATQYGTTSSGVHCTNWTSTATTGSTGFLNSGNNARWTNSNLACTTVTRLMCMLHGAPSLTFADVEGATPNTVYFANPTVVGGGISNYPVQSSGGLEIRVNGSGGWGTSAIVNDGDILNMRMTSSATEGAEIFGTLTFPEAHSLTWMIRNLRENLFVRTAASYNGNLGGLSGANATCLTEMQTNNFLGKSGATINASTVKAFLCDSNSCQMPKANSTYWFASAGSTTLGGASFTSGPTGEGPGNAADWSTSTYFGSSTTLWTGHLNTGSTNFYGVKSPSTCLDWSSNVLAQSGGFGGTAFAGGGRWANGTASCNNTSRLICMVTSNPGPAPQSVDPFTISDVTDAAPNSYVESSVALTGSFSNLVVYAFTNKEVRKNSTGLWSASVTVNPGDTLNIRALSNANPGQTVDHFITVGNRSATWAVTNWMPNVIVLTNATYPGNLGGLAGANAKCLSEVQANSFWGKGALTLDSTTVSAFLCDSTTCQNARANKTYFMAKLGTASSTPTYFNTDATGKGPGDALNWWSGTTLATSAYYWSGRSSTSASLWGTTPADGFCTNWTSSSSVPLGTQGWTGTNDQRRWTHTNVPCNNSRNLLCIIRQNTPDALTFTTVNGASTSTVYETSGVIAGLLTGGFTVTSSDGIEVRKNGSGGWGTSVSVSNGDTLNVRMTSSPNPGGSVTGKVYFRGETPMAWTINNL